jgi:hypothetical protein
MQRKRIADATKGIGKPKVGGPFELVDTEGMPFTEENLKQKYALVSSYLKRYDHGYGIDNNGYPFMDRWLKLLFDRSTSVSHIVLTYALRN